MSERLSYFITAVVAVLGWLITHYVDRITQTPTIEYAISETRSGGRVDAVYRLTNISRTQSFGRIDVQFLARRQSPITRLVIRPVEPASEGPNSETQGPAAANFVIERLMPGATITFLTSTQGVARPELRVDAPEPVKLTTRSFETWLATNEMTVVACLILFWAVALLGLISLQFLPGRQTGSAAAAPAAGAKPGQNNKRGRR